MLTWVIIFRIKTKDIPVEYKLQHNKEPPPLIKEDRIRLDTRLKESYLMLNNDNQ